MHPAGHVPFAGQGTPPGDGAGAGDVLRLGGNDGSHPAGHAPLAGHGTPPPGDGAGEGDEPPGMHPAGHTPIVGHGTPFWAETAGNTSVCVSNNSNAIAGSVKRAKRMIVFILIDLFFG